METNNNPEEKTEGQVPSASKIQIIKNKIIEKPYAAVGIIAASFFIIIAVVMLTLYMGKKPSTNFAEAPEKEVQIQIIENITPAYEDFSRQLKLFFFEHNISKDEISETLSEYNGEYAYSLQVNRQIPENDKIWQEIADLLKINNFSLISYENGEVGATGEDYSLIIKSLPSRSVVEVAPITKNKGKLALLLDDAGANYELVDRVTKLNIPMAIAVLPHLQYSRQSADLIRARGKLVFLHFPMEPLSYPQADPGEGAVLVNMPEVLVQAVTKSNVENLGKIDGTNNHMGSAVTENTEKMSQVLDSLRPYSNIFVDSNTSAKSVALKICKEKGFKCGLNRKFLDNENDHDYIKEKMYEAAKLADSQGGIITIGHIRVDTIIVLEQMVPELQKMGYEFVDIRTMLE